MAKTNKLEKIKTLKMLQLWGQLPNPDFHFFHTHGVSPHKALRDLSYSPEVQSAILARESAVIGDPWEIIGDNEEETKFITYNLEKLGINSIFREIFHALWYGYTILQHPIQKVNNHWEYIKIDSLPSEWFCFDKKSQLIPSNHTNTTPLNMTIGDLDKEVELVQYRPTFINPYGESLLTRVFWSATWIRGTMDLWISYIDRFGDDSIVGRVELANDDKKMAMLHAIQEFRSSGAMVIEGSDSIDILKSDKSSSSQLFKDFYDLCTKQISKVVLGHSSALDSTPGKLGNEASISIVRQDITQDDKSIIAETVNKLIRHLCLINNFSSRTTFAWKPEQEDEKSRIERDTMLHNIGFEFSEEYICKTYRFNKQDISKSSPKQ